MTASKAFQFCLTYKRTTEFRRLCDTLRNHLANLNKYREQRDRPDLTLPETQQLYLETRFEQLKVRTASARAAAHPACLGPASCLHANLPQSHPKQHRPRPSSFNPMGIISWPSRLCQPFLGISLYCQVEAATCSY